MTTAVTPFFSDERAAQAAATRLEKASLIVLDRQEEIVTEYPPLPYTTAALLEDATVTLAWTSAQVTETAQSLFEQGWITYPRTDSTRVASEAILKGREIVCQLFGSEALGSSRAEWFKPVVRQPEGKTATTLESNRLEAHEAIRPTDPAKIPEALRHEIASESLALYHLIWARFLASLMKPMRCRVVTVTMEAAS